MKTLTKEEVKKIVENHQHWVNKDCRDWQDMRADFTDVYVGHIDLSEVNLSQATFDRVIFDSVDLTGANLDSVDVRNSMFVNTTLTGASLRISDISHTKFNELDMAKTDFTYSRICMSEFSGVNMKDSKFIDATIRQSWFCECYMCDADFNKAWIKDSVRAFTNVALAKNWPLTPLTCPDTGSFIGWKKAYDEAGFSKIVCLEIPADAKRLSAFGRRCRCDKAKVIGIYSRDGSPYDGEVHSMWDREFVYRVGQMVAVDNFDDDRFKECAPGIHFFITRQEAMDFGV